MRTTAHGSNLIQLTHLRLLNAYLVREDDGLTLVDTTMGRAHRGILAAATALGAPIRRIVLTHAHLDHVGTLDALAAELPGVEVLIGTREARLLAGDRTLDPDEPKGRLASFKQTRTQPTGTLDPGDRVGSLEVAAAPGHTPGQIALLDVRDRTLIAGDAFITIGSVATSAKGDWRFPFPALGAWDRATALRTARELRALEPSRLAAGHGPVVDAPAAAMDAAIARGT
jgi:glyoxylase-like metal-dependent hydrolase (beta-lactamase superfamily II)